MHNPPGARHARRIAAFTVSAALAPIIGTAQEAVPPAPAEALEDLLQALVPAAMPVRR